MSLRYAITAAAMLASGGPAVSANIEQQSIPFQTGESSYATPPLPGTPQPADIPQYRPAEPSSLPSATVGTYQPEAAYQEAPKLYTAPPPQPIVQPAPQNAHNVRYVSGGVGASERARLEATQGDYNLKIEMAKTQGFYIANAGVVIRDANGAEILKAVSDGPLFMVQLDPGTYTVEATHESETKSQKVTVGNAGQKKVMMLWVGKPES